MSFIEAFWQWLGHTNPDVWAATASWTTAAIAIGAGVVAYKQVGEARRLREEQAQPYVVAYMEINEAANWIVDLVVKNYGTTIARDVRITSNPPIRRTKDAGRGTEDVWLFDRLPVLVPGQEWRTLWDVGFERKDSNLPDRHRVVVTYADSRGRPMEPTESELDWGSHWQNLRVNAYGIHQAAEALRAIQKSVAKWGEPHGGLRVYARDGDAKDARDLKRMRVFERKMRQREEQETANTRSIDPPIE
ncbi:hypothetical protein [Dactylosporangium darangshiense]|uniref:Uncharacterized protein n=1 Tax=Dactylosporangium darangshiense TaxID=579108 RepID=A0ABP8DMV5_9ACTN